jgi:hypothetical protein
MFAPRKYYIFLRWNWECISIVQRLAILGCRKHEVQPTMFKNLPKAEEKMNQIYVPIICLQVLFEIFL